MTISTRKYEIKSTIAIHGSNYDVTGLHWAATGRAARAKEINFRRQIDGCSTVQIWETTVVGWHANEFASGDTSAPRTSQGGKLFSNF